MILKLIFVLTGLVVVQCQSNTTRALPDSLKIGVATSAYQIEGAWNADGKTESIWDHLVHTNLSSTIDNSTGDIACNSYNLWQRDVEMLREIGAQFYRFSLSWTRILSDAPNLEINQAGVDYYNNLINELLKYNIEPVVTIFHWDLPQKIQELGGWANAEIVKYLTEYANVAYKLFGDRVKTWITISGLKQICVNSYVKGENAPQVISPGTGVYLCIKNTLLAHASMWHLYNNTYRATQEGVCGYTVQAQWYEAATNSSDDIQAAEDAASFEKFLYLDPVYSESGDYPEIVKQRVYNKSIEQGFSTSRLPELTAEEIEYIRGTYDYIGINSFANYIVSRSSTKNVTYGDSPSYNDDKDYEEVTWTEDKNITNTEAMYLVYKDLYNRYGDIPMNIFATGKGDNNANDVDRLDFLQGVADSVLNAIDDGVNITRVTAWALMDNFEWYNGYNQRFGLYEVDFNDENRTRTPRTSAYVFKYTTENRVLDFDYMPSENDTLSIDN